MAEKVKKVWVVGHKNPDTDSICAAIAYANLKNAKASAQVVYEAKRAGEINEETKYVLNYFNQKRPHRITDAGAQIKDIEIRKTVGVSGKISMKKAWEMMKQLNVATLPITDANNKLEGIITTGDIATSYMDIYDNHVVSRAKTPYRNIIETIEGTLLVGNEHAYFQDGKVLVAAANPDMMEEYIEDNDLVIIGNRYESQLCALEMNASCMIVCSGAKVTKTIQKMAQDRDCVLISTNYDSYTVARLINQSIPIKFFMVEEDVVSFKSEDYVEDVREIMLKEKYRDFPVLDNEGKYAGMISRRNLLNTKKKQLILVDHNERSQAIDNVDAAEIIEIIDHHRIGSLETMSPVFFRNQPLGCTATIVYQMYREQGVEITKDIAGLLCAAILSDTLMYRSPTCTEIDKIVAEELAIIAGIDTETFAKEMFQAGSDFSAKSAEEIFYQDFKAFVSNGIEFGVGQISAMSRQELGMVREKLLPYMEQVMFERKIPMVFIMLTNILEENTYMICAGEGASKLIEDAYHVQEKDGYYLLKGVVSRKKQLIPKFMAALQEQ
ncbi:MAG: putative manganese-dependent inorganic diphosphatase [Eubacterium sp.]|nr:putative manganese-dependent inorganic diphosphatase [Eubacterium sp.]